MEIPEHQLLQPIASGAYGQVWLARNALGTLRAVKIVRRDRFECEEDFEREFRGLQKFEPVSRTHEALVDILQIGKQDDWFYYVMELADHASSDSGSPSATSLGGKPSIGDQEIYTPQTLRQLLRHRGFLAANQVIELGCRLASALAHLHGRRLVHRDVKPSNILFVNGQAKLADAGLVAAVGDARSLVGTPGYIPPEGHGTPQADFYSLGRVLYEAAFGMDRQDFPRVPHDIATRPDHAQLLELNEIIVTSCAQDPRERYQTAEEMASELGLLERGQSVLRKRASGWRWKIAKRITVPGIALALLAIGGGQAFRRFNETDQGFSSTERAEAKRSITTQNRTATFAQLQDGREIGLTDSGTRVYGVESVSGTNAPVNEARRLYLRAAHEREESTLESTLQAYKELTSALELEPKFVDAYYLMFGLNWGAWSDQLPPYKNFMANVRWCRDKIGAINTNCPQYHIVSAGIKFLDWHFEDALTEMQVSLRLDPSFRGDGFYGFMILRARGDAATARREWKTAERFNPNGPDLVTEVQLGTTDYFEGNLDKAIEQFSSAAAYESRSVVAHEWLGRAYEANKQYELALHEFETAENLVNGIKPEVSSKYALYRSALKDGGSRAMWQAMVNDLKQSPPPDPCQMAKLYARLDQKEEAFHWLEQARQEHAGGIAGLLVDDWWDPLRDDARFKELLRKVGLPDVRPGRK
jgi:serine/threonine protein kinase